MSDERLDTHDEAEGQVESLSAEDIEKFLKQEPKSPLYKFMADAITPRVYVSFQHELSPHDLAAEPEAEFGRFFMAWIEGKELWASTAYEQDSDPKSFLLAKLEEDGRWVVS